MASQPKVHTGLDVIQRQAFAPLHGLSIGLVTHPAAVDSELRHASDILAGAPGVRLAAIFGPEHGITGAAQDLIGVRHGDGIESGVRVYSLYGDTADSLRPTDEQLQGLDALVVDLQDVGSRYYTFQATMLFCLEAASRKKLQLVVLDRPNPIGGLAVEGPLLEPGFESFVGIHSLVARHGMTIGELAQLYRAERHLEGDLVVVPCEGWRRDMYFDDTGLSWVMPSPNMPTLDTALVYPGQCLIEGTNASEGRGTTRPFELCGLPGIDSRRLCGELEAERLPGVKFRPAWFRPTFQKHAGQTCGGLQIHVIERRAFQPVRTGLSVLAAMRRLAGKHFDWRREPYEFVKDRLAIDLLFGSERERQALEQGRTPAEIAKGWPAEEEEFRRRRQPYLLY
jgi:uncharacterized protein YbbC (DUF1343 family)